ncbi:MAG: hypothetical protein CVT73_00505 [Alphaproteobacteria bacterium HGW-Alphaproteobacteria-12]|nr:MAG: hypothetical protein CVT73_00505 [Alphaproteobacteria bacterium HGW-Alphaproteobacteria-12]
MKLSLIAIFIAGLLAGCSATGEGAPTALSGGSGGAGGSASALGGETLGVAGGGGTSEKTLGFDAVTPLLGDSGVVGSTVSGGSGGIVARNLSAETLSSVPVLGEVAGQLPIEDGVLPAEVSGAFMDGLAQLGEQAPALGVSGGGGLGEDLFGTDITGTLIGTQGGLAPDLLAGGNDGQLGSAAPADSAPLAPVGGPVAGVLNGAQASPNDGNVNDLEPVLSPLLLAALGAGGESGSPAPGVALPDVPIDELAPVLLPGLDAAMQVLATPVLPDGSTGYDVILPVVFGPVAGVAGETLPLGTIADTAVTVLP